MRAYRAQAQTRLWRRGYVRWCGPRKVSTSENLPKQQNYSRKSKIPIYLIHIHRQAAPFAARNRDYPVVYAHSIHAYEVYACEVHAREMHPYEVHTCEMLVYEVHTHEMDACEVHAHDVDAREVSAHEVHAYEVYVHEVHAHEVHACEMHVYEVHAHEGFCEDLARQNTVAHLSQLQLGFRRCRILVMLSHVGFMLSHMGFSHRGGVLKVSI